MLVLAAHAVRAATIITIGDSVIASNVTRLGLNMTGNNYYDSPTLKQTDSKNFEGSSYRQCHEGTLFTNGFATWRTTTSTYWNSGWNRMISGGMYRILSGPHAFTTGTIMAVKPLTMMTWNSAQTSTVPFFEFSAPIALPGGAPVRNMGLMVQQFNMGEGRLNGTYGYWLQTNCYVVTGDVSPDSWGSGALLMVGATNLAYFRLATVQPGIATATGMWRCILRAKRAAGSPVFQVRTESVTPATTWTLSLADSWQSYTCDVTVATVTGAQPLFYVTASSGNVLVDDCDVRDIDDTGPHAFRGDVVEVLKDMRPGILRYLQMGGNTLSNTILPCTAAYAYLDDPTTVGPYGSSGWQTYGMHEFLQLCEDVGAEAWYNLPGALDPWEMDALMEYIGAPAGVGYGQLRAALGHPEPWTKTLPRVHVELGNEIWNSAGYWWCGFKGPDYWSNMFALAKASAYYTNTVIFHSAGQNFSASMANQVIRDAPTGDRYSIAPYVLSSLNTTDLSLNNTDDKFYRWLFGYPLHTTYSNGMPQHYAVMTNRSTEYSVYEFNHHTTGGSAGYNDVNKFVASAGAGVSIINTMLALLKQYGIRSQCLFNFLQRDFDAYSLGTPGRVWLWGVTRDTRAGSVRHRPTGLGFIVANRVLGGDLVTTTHTGDNPAFTANGYFRSETGVKTYTWPTLHSYAFRDGARRALIIVNFDLWSNQTVSVRFPAGEGALAATASTWYTAASYVSNHNETLTAPPLVTIAAAGLTAFTNGVLVSIPPFTIQSFEWQAATNPQNPSVMINNGALTTVVPGVTLTLHADSPDPAQMQVSESASFAGAVWTNHLESLAWELSHGEGMRTVYARFRTSGGALSDTASAHITLVPEPGLLLWLAALAGGCALSRH